MVVEFAEKSFCLVSLRSWFRLVFPVRREPYFEIFNTRYGARHKIQTTKTKIFVGRGEEQTKVHIMMKIKTYARGKNMAGK